VTGKTKSEDGRRRQESDRSVSQGCESGIDTGGRRRPSDDDDDDDDDRKGRHTSGFLDH
jgi:hypothetical protein